MLTEFERRAACAAIGDRQPREECLGLGVEMRAADHRDESRARRGSGVNGGALLRGACRRARATGAAARRLGPRSRATARPCAGAATMPRRGRPPVTIATLTVNSSRPANSSRVPSSGSTRTKLAGNAGRRRAARGLFRHDARTGKHAGKAFEDHGFGGVVGGGHRRMVGLGPRIERAARGRQEWRPTAIETMVVSSSSSRPSTVAISPSRGKAGRSRCPAS